MSTDSALVAPGAGSILALNAGSSSIKLGIYDAGPHEPRALSRRITVEVERIGSADSSFRMRDAAGGEVQEPMRLADFDAALRVVFARLEQRGMLANIAGIGHRIVHGGHELTRHQRITPDVADKLRTLVPLARNHTPQALLAIDYVARLLPSVVQVACFDTAFHRTMPRVARLTGLGRIGDARSAEATGIERFGFHGLSYEYLCNELAALDPAAARGRMIAAHLGNGASMCAIKDGRSVDTTMGFTPNSGLLMGTRSGDIDPGVVAYLLRERKMSVDALEDLLDKSSGLLGVSGSSADMRELLARERVDPAAADAVQLFCHRARKYLGAYASVLGGVDTLIFSGGIGERAAAIRERICAGQQHLGIRIDAARNAAHAAVVSAADSPVTVRVIHTDEEAMIVRHTLAVLG